MHLDGAVVDRRGEQLLHISVIVGTLCRVGTVILCLVGISTITIIRVNIITEVADSLIMQHLATKTFRPIQLLFESISELQQEAAGANPVTQLQTDRIVAFKLAYANLRIDMLILPTLCKVRLFVMLLCIWPLFISWLGIVVSSIAALLNALKVVAMCKDLTFVVKADARIIAGIAVNATHAITEGTSSVVKNDAKITSGSASKASNTAQSTSAVHPA